MSDDDSLEDHLRRLPPGVGRMVYRYHSQMLAARRARMRERLRRELLSHVPVPEYLIPIPQSRRDYYIDDFRRRVRNTHTETIERWIPMYRFSRAGMPNVANSHRMALSYLEWYLRLRQRRRARRGRRRY